MRLPRSSLPAPLPPPDEEEPSLEPPEAESSEARGESSPDESSPPLTAILPGARRGLGRRTGRRRGRPVPRRGRSPGRRSRSPPGRWPRRRRCRRCRAGRSGCARGWSCAHRRGHGLGVGKVRDRQADLGAHEPGTRVLERRVPAAALGQRGNDRQAQPGPSAVIAGYRGRSARTRDSRPRGRAGRTRSRTPTRAIPLSRSHLIVTGEPRGEYLIAFSTRLSRIAASSLGAAPTLASPSPSSTISCRPSLAGRAPAVRRVACGVREARGFVRGGLLARGELEQVGDQLVQPLGLSLGGVQLARHLPDRRSSPRPPRGGGAAR